MVDLEGFLQEPIWAKPSHGGDPYSALRDITCDAAQEQCEAQVAPPGG